MSCVCDNNLYGMKTTIITSNNFNFCCPLGASVINGECGCDSSMAIAANKRYIGFS